MGFIVSYLGKGEKQEKIEGFVLMFGSKYFTGAHFIRVLQAGF